MSESAKDFLKRRRVPEQRRTEKECESLKLRERAARFLAQPPIERVFFYPACGSDYVYPLRRFAPLCNTFIFCEWAAQGETFANRLEGLKAGACLAAGVQCTASCLLEVETVEQLGDMTQLLETHFGGPNHGMDRELCKYLGRPQPRWARYAELLLDDAKELKFFFFYLEGVNLYQNLFTDHQAAPAILCLKNWGAIGGEWTSFGMWKAPLGQAVRNGPAQPKYMITDRPHDWPYTQLVQKFLDWGSAGCPKMWARKATARKTTRAGK